MCYDVRDVYVLGVEFSYEELQTFFNHEDNIKLIEKYNCENLAELWYDLEYPMAAHEDDPHESEIKYYFGLEIFKFPNSEKMHEILKKEDTIRKDIRDFCEKYDIVTDSKENEIKFIKDYSFW